MKTWLPLLLLLSGCEKPEPTFPAPSEPADSRSAVECRLLETVFPRLIEANPQGNVVLAPHALASTMAAMGGGQAPASPYGKTSWKELKDADAATGDPVRHDGVSGPSSEKQKRPAAPAGSDFIRSELALARKSESKDAWLSLFDAQVAGVPMVTRSVFKPAQVEFGGNLAVAGAEMSFGAQYGVSQHFRSAFWSATSREDWLPAAVGDGVIVTFSLPINEADAPPLRLPGLPCGGGVLPADSRKVEVDFRVPTFCARSRGSLANVAPEVGSSLSADVLFSARLAFDARGTVNLPPYAVRSPALLRDYDAPRTAHELHLDRPFFVTVHDRSTGAILYVAYVREANDVNACR